MNALDFSCKRSGPSQFDCDMAMPELCKAAPVMDMCVGSTDSYN